jgi:hypothetical protein
MNMVRHKAKGENSVPESLAGFLKDLIETITVLVVGENILTGIAAKDYVVNRSRCVDARFACHG